MDPCTTTGSTGVHGPGYLDGGASVVLTCTAAASRRFTTTASN